MIDLIKKKIKDHKNQSIVDVVFMWHLTKYVTDVPSEVLLPVPLQNKKVHSSVHIQYNVPMTIYL